MSRSWDKKSKVGSIVAASVAVVGTLTFNAFSYMGVFDGKGDMNTQEDRIALALEGINTESTGLDKEVVVDCGISSLENRFIDRDSGGWVVRIPKLKSQVMHLRSEICDGFTNNEPEAVERALFALGYTLYGYSASDPCGEKIAAGLFGSAHKDRFADNPKLAEEFTEDMVSFTFDAGKCPKTFDELVGKN